MSSDILVRDQIFSTYDSLYDAEKKVADYLISHPSEAIEMSVSELASHCDAVSYTHRQQEEQVISNEIDIDQMDKSLNNIMISKVEEIKATFHNFNPEELREIVDLIIHANLIEFAAMGDTIPIALDGSYKFNQLGLKAVSSTIWESQEAFSRTLRKGDVFFAISASGASKRLVKMVEIVKDNGVTTIAITNQSKSPLAELCDHVLLTATREHIFHDQVSFTRMAAMSVIDTLFLLLFSTKWDSFENVAQHEQSVAEEKL